MLKDVMVQPIQKVTMSHVYLGLRASENSAQQRSGVISGFNLARRIGTGGQSLAEMPIGRVRTGTVVPCTVTSCFVGLAPIYQWKSKIEKVLRW